VPRAISVAGSESEEAGERRSSPARSLVFPEVHLGINRSTSRAVATPVVADGFFTGDLIGQPLLPGLGGLLLRSATSIGLNRARAGRATIGGTTATCDGPSFKGPS